MLNLYEILEVSEKASKEVIDKAYHVLVKKYHPDLQQEEEKKDAEERMKQINEAYEILSNEEKRKQYDSNLEAQRSKELYTNEKTQSQEQGQQEVYYNNNNQNVYKNENINKNNSYRNAKKIQKEINRAYANAYNDYLRSLGYKVREPWTFKKFLEQLKILGVLVIVFVIIWIFPPTHKMLVDIYEGNIIIKTLVDVIINVFLGIFDGIKKFIFNIFKI